MNESYPSHRAPQQNPMKHYLLHRVALMHPMSHRRVKGVPMGPRNSSLRLVLVAVVLVVTAFLGLVLPALLPLIIHVIAPLGPHYFQSLLLDGLRLQPFLSHLYLVIQPRRMSHPKVPSPSVSVGSHPVLWMKIAKQKTHPIPIRRPQSRSIQPRNPK